jgi:DNA-binding NtrC family response regulator
MTTTALAITTDYSKVLSNSNATKGMAPGRKKILLIDDQSDRSLFIGLQQEGYEVTACQSPQKAWTVVWKLRPHLIVINLTNPSRGDISTLQGCGVLAGAVPIIIAAPLSRNGAIIKALEKVAAVFLSFPLGPYGIGKILHDLEMSNYENDSGVYHGGTPIAR